MQILVLLSLTEPFCHKSAGLYRVTATQIYFIQYNLFSIIFPYRNQQGVEDELKLLNENMKTVQKY